MCSRSLKRRLCSLEPLKMSLTISCTFFSSSSSSFVSLRKEISTLRSFGNPLARRQHMDHKHKRRWRPSLTNASIQDHQSHCCGSSSFLETLPSLSTAVQSHVNKHSQSFKGLCWNAFSLVRSLLSWARTFPQACRFPPRTLERLKNASAHAPLQKNGN